MAMLAIAMMGRALVGPSAGKTRDLAIIQGLLDGGTRVDRVSAGLSGRLGTCAGRWPGLPLRSRTASFRVTRRA